MRIFLTGASGAAGLAVLRTAITDPDITHITVLVRGPLPTSAPSSPKMAVVTHKDFRAYPAELVRGHDACVWALGRSSSGVSEAEYTAITHDYPVAALSAFAANAEPGRPFRFVYFSGDGADPSGKSRLLYGRVKGLAEKDLLGIANASGGAVSAQMLRPAYFFPGDAADREHTRSRTARALDCVMAPVLRTVAPSLYVPIGDLARVALGLAKGKLGDAQVFSNTDIQEAAKKL